MDEEIEAADSNKDEFQIAADATEDSSETPGDIAEQVPKISWGGGDDRPRRRRSLVYTAIVILVTGGMLLAGGASAYAYDLGKSARIVPDVRIGDVLVGGLTEDEARTRIRSELDVIRARRITLRAYDKAYTVNLGQLDVDADIDSAIESAIAAGRDLGIGGRLKRWVGGGGQEIVVPFGVRPSGEAIDKRIVAAIAGQVNREPTEAAIDESSGDLVFRPAAPGVELESRAASQLVEKAALSAIAGETLTDVSLPTKELKPQGDDIGAAILVRVSEQRLYYYENATLVGTYKVSTGTRQYPTPLGRFRIIEKIVNPSWTNPAPNGWGKDMPARIGPGPGNPLGTRALQLNTPGILIHGTSHVNLLGSPASHGCIRMAGAEIEGLFPKVPVNTPVFVRA